MDKIFSFEETIECAKSFKDFDNVYIAVSLQPKWLTAISETRRWAVIHHITFSGDTSRLDQLLALQTPNKEFRLLTETRDHQTIFDVARLVNDDGKMLKHVERIAKLDEMLNYARICEWDKCYEIVTANTEYGNQKPPYRRFFLIHHLACANAIKEFERFSNIRGFHFILNLRADRKKINQIARENNGIEFAKYIEEKYPTHFQDDTQDDQLYEPTDQAKEHTKNVSIVMEHRNIVYVADPSTTTATEMKSRSKADSDAKEILAKQKEEKRRQQTSNVIKIMTDNPIDTIRSLLECSLTRAIMTDPVMAADGFTYERSAIENWIGRSERSPRTNEPLAHKNLNSNTVIKQIIDTLTQK